MNITINEKGQAVAPQTQLMSEAAFQRIDHTEIRWMGNASIFINSRGTCIMIDPLLEGFDMPLLYEMPILAKKVPNLDAVLITHIDNDHFSRPTLKNMKEVTKAFHAPHFVAEEMHKEGLEGIGHSIGDTFNVGTLEITLTPAQHNWQSASTKYNYREWKEEDYCGFLLGGEDGTMWLPGDSRLLDEHLKMPQPDILFFDFSDNDWHMTLDGAIKLANTYPKAELICIHWGSVDAPTMSPFNGNPEVLLDRISNPERIKVLAPGEVYILKNK